MWYLCNDEHVDFCKNAKVLDTNAYILVYEKANTIQSYEEVKVTKTKGNKNIQASTIKSRKLPDNTKYQKQWQSEMKKNTMSNEDQNNDVQDIVESSRHSPMKINKPKHEVSTTPKPKRHSKIKWTDKIFKKSNTHKFKKSSEVTDQEKINVFIE